MSELVRQSRHELDTETTARKQLVEFCVSVDPWPTTFHATLLPQAARVADMKDQLGRLSAHLSAVEAEAEETRKQAEAALTAKDTALAQVIVSVCACVCPCDLRVVPCVSLRKPVLRLLLR